MTYLIQMILILMKATKSEEEYTTTLEGRSSGISNAQTNDLYADEFQPSIASTSITTATTKTTKNVQNAIKNFYLVA